MPERQIWATLLEPCILQSGMTLSYADWADDGVDLSEGARVVAGDEQGNTCTATVFMRGRAAGRIQIILRLDWSTFQEAGAHGDAGHPGDARRVRLPPVRPGPEPVQRRASRLDDPACPAGGAAPCFAHHAW
jgi:hypothetical protein